VPAVESVIRGYIVPYGKWVVHGTFSIFGEHYVRAGSGDTVDAFVTVDCGVERDFLRYFTFYADLNNITNAEGSWWTDTCQIPGVGLYAGIKTR